MVALYGVAVLVLDSGVQFKETILPICLPNDSEADYLDDIPAIISGWDITFSTYESNPLKSIQTLIFKQR